MRASGAQLRPAPFRGTAVRQLARGKLLVAARRLPDPNFARTVVLLADVGDEGAMGLIVNRRTNMAVGSLLPGVEPSLATAARAFFGGPVAVSGLLALLRSADPPPNARHVVEDVYLLNDPESLTVSLRRGHGPDRLRVYVGYAGWGPGQLQDETASGVWHVLDGEARIVFDEDPDSTWLRQIERTEALSARCGGRCAGGYRITPA